MALLRGCGGVDPGGLDAVLEDAECALHLRLLRGLRPEIFGQEFLPQAAMSRHVAGAELAFRVGEIVDDELSSGTRGRAGELPLAWFWCAHALKSGTRDRVDCALPAWGRCRVSV